MDALELRALVLAFGGNHKQFRESVEPPVKASAFSLYVSGDRTIGPELATKFRAVAPLGPEFQRGLVAPEEAKRIIDALGGPDHAHERIGCRPCTVVAAWMGWRRMPRYLYDRAKKLCQSVPSGGTK